MFLKVLKKRSNAKGQTRKLTHFVFWQIYRRVKKSIDSLKSQNVYVFIQIWMTDFSLNFVICVLFEFL